jgi:hypothetical protein
MAWLLSVMRRGIEGYSTLFNKGEVMKLIDVEEKFPPFDLPTGLAVERIESGKFKQYIPADKPKPVQQLTWRVFRGEENRGVLDPPFITYHCASCCNGGQMSGPSCHKTQVARCCGGFTTVPSDIAERFVALRKEYEPNNRKYMKAVKQAADEQEKKRQAVLLEERRILARQLRTSQR